MNIQRIFALTKKELKKTIREPAVLFMIFLFPVVFVVAFGAILWRRSAAAQPATYQVGVVNLDSEQSAVVYRFSSIHLSATQNVNVNIYTDNQTAQSDLSQGKMQAVILVPSSFSDSITSYNASPN